MKEVFLPIEDNYELKLSIGYNSYFKSITFTSSIVRRETVDGYTSTECMAYANLNGSDWNTGKATLEVLTRKSKKKIKYYSDKLTDEVADEILKSYQNGTFSLETIENLIG